MDDPCFPTVSPLSKTSKLVAGWSSLHKDASLLSVASILDFSSTLSGGQPLDIGVLIKIEIHKCGKEESKKEAMGFPSLITYFCIQTGTDLSAEEMKEPSVDIGINQWYSLYPSRGLKRPRRPKRARIEAEDSESEDEGSKPEDEDVEGAEEDINVRLLTQMLKVLKATLSKQTDAHATRKYKIKAVKDEILREIMASERRMRAMISETEEGPSFPSMAPSHICPIGGPAISEEASQKRIATERSLKELADREAAARDPSSKGKGKLLGTS
ncbi:hypothetical protein LWI28_004050 [Acer negundo]|uniref:Uncharacterized protein n=1 Tax=Acer negundo TaxID=4023 RepID=A0AAD5ISF3_ACENE|nr:hypothetical protein LWI28_004050 [Acer negundo]